MHDTRSYDPSAAIARSDKVPWKAIGRQQSPSNFIIPLVSVETLALSWPMGLNPSKVDLGGGGELQIAL